MQPELYLGTRVLRGSLEHYARLFNMLEVRATSGEFPRKGTLRKWRSSVPDDFQFVVVMPPDMADEADWPAERDGLVKSVVQQLGASVVLLPTAASFRPTSKNKERLMVLSERLKGLAPSVAWEPRGMWDFDEAAELSMEAGWMLVGDPARDALMAGPSVYGRIRGLGESARLSPRRLQIVVENLRTRNSGYVVIETDGPGAVARDLRSAFGTDLFGDDVEGEDGFTVIEPDESNDTSFEGSGE